MRALIFDCDGVLAETERDGHRAAFNRMFAAEGLDFEWTEDDYASVLSVAGGKERLRRLCTDAFVERHGLPTEQAALDEPRGVVASTQDADFLGPRRRGADAISRRRPTPRF